MWECAHLEPALPALAQVEVGLAVSEPVVRHCLALAREECHEACATGVDAVVVSMVFLY